MAADRPRPRPLAPDDILFPPPPSSLSALLGSLRRSALSTHNRLASILADADFVQRAASSLRRPLVANQRCGAWYLPPGAARASAYFKSTDGHERAWKFSTRRLNLHLVDLAEQHDGLIVVDSTRRGKRMPDALAATVPIWCAVLNQVLLPAHPLSAQLFLPPHLLATTHDQIAALIPSFVAALRDLRLPSLPTSLTKPLRPLWITPSSALPPCSPSSSAPIFRDYRPVICLTASRRVPHGADPRDGYVQGAADDTENWAHGLTPALFWAHADLLLRTDEPLLPDLIARLVRQDQLARQEQAHDAGSRVPLAPCLSVCCLPLAAPGGSPDGSPDGCPDGSAAADCHVALTADAPTPSATWVKSRNYMQVALGRSKTASRNLRLALPDICRFVAAFFERSGGPPPEQCRLVVACDSGRDISVGTALALLCYLFDERGVFRAPDGNAVFTKTLVKTRLGSIMTAYPAANPSRQTLQSVNSFLMDWTR
ncbi:uncharacterized protein UV8b_06884 [Ustilaginoidea virens]|uniref:Initiator tRNA phosphoribosyl transferase n=1 Tax=Ustilaginoidea virens TaxID=1159556 RepID=A0A8E5HWJ8_USTVR|nr:uncharacterized protein UV8b_06884 [Ustilaginoidea virens]QUC22643.1 hypothetical protein UV8b_06884 [Ustilaginoidea virens]